MKRVLVHHSWMCTFLVSPPTEKERKAKWLASTEERNVPWLRHSLAANSAIRTDSATARFEISLCLIDLALSFQVVLERGNGKAKNQADWMKANNFIASQPECLLPAPNLDDRISCALFTLFLLIHWSKTTLAWKDSWINKVFYESSENITPSRPRTPFQALTDPNPNQIQMPNQIVLFSSVRSFD